MTIANAHAERARPAPGYGDVAGVAAPELDRLLGTGQDTEGRYRPRELSQGDDHRAPASASAAPSGCDGTACMTTAGAVPANNSSIDVRADQLPIGGITPSGMRI
ncbi:hypothetical protein [Nocardia grenadensis]|uniref:hypothetical protein n=1 Tax=Nocardia grenadensis TaxID=931537 RepID=UPI003D8EF7AF